MKIEDYIRYDQDTGLLFWIKDYARQLGGNRAGRVNTLGYVVVHFEKKYWLGHRLAWYLATGNHPKYQIDHINGDRADNRLINLREASHGENNRNRGAHKDNVSGFKGVAYMKRDGRYKARINVNKVCINLGHYDTAEEAHEAYMKAARELHGQFAKA